MQDINDIMRLLPHRYPFLLVDRVLETNGVDKLIAIKNVTVNEAQACAMLAFARMGGERDPEKLFYFASIDNARFKRVVIPGDQLRFECTFLREKLGMIKMHCDATVDGQLAACADMMCSYRSPK